MAAANYASANANNNIHGLGTDNPPKDKDKKTPDSLFGPNIGVISSGPSWTTTTEKKVLKDELTMDIVKSWIEKSKEPSQATTTLQALVNLKRPTLRLSPIDDEQHSHSHALEFEFDCDAPKCGIYVNVLLPPGHPEAPSAESAETPSKPRYTKALVFESIVDGGFGKTLKLEQGAVLELGRYEFHPSPASSVAAAAPPAAELQETPAESQQRPTTTNHSRRRITHFFHRRRHNNQNLSVSGPALAVVDASSPANAPAEGDKKKKEDDHEGVKVTIRLAALDDQGTELHSPNEQVTYLCVERFGARSEKKEVEKKDEQGGGSEASEQPQETHEEEHDNRPWVVKVVKREATIGPHTFQLHEIYGLTSSSNAHTPPALPPPSSPVLQQHTYPPQPAPSTTEEEDPTSECLLCLSSPREVVLLPCRHLVACKECALNMVEFGAGGAITQSTEDNGNGADGGADGGNAEGGGNAATTTPATPTTANPRRKRKAKGWFCPVCRQPYTSLLRITTNPPPEPVKAEPRTDSQDEERDVTEAEAEEGGLPLPVTTPNNNSSGGLLSRPVGLFRSLTGRSATAN